MNHYLSCNWRANERVSQVLLPAVIDVLSENNTIAEQLASKFIVWFEASNHWVDMFGNILDDSIIGGLYWRHFRYYDPLVNNMIVRN